jgi:hypothetical protein
MTMAASALGKRFLVPALSAEKPDLRVRPRVQPAAECGVSSQLNKRRGTYQ